MRRRTPATRSALRGGVIVLGSALSFTVATAAGIALHIGTPPARRFIAKTVNETLARTLFGTVTISRLDRLDLAGLGGLSVTIRDLHGNLVIDAKDVQADFRALALARSVLLGKGDVVLRVDRVQIGHAEVVLAEEEDGSLSIVSAFTPRATAAPKPQRPGPDPRGLSLSFPDVTVLDAWAHGQLGSGPELDAEVRHVRASLDDDLKVLKLDVAHGEIETRGLPEHIDPQGVIQGRMRIPSTVDGQSADASLIFDGVVARQHTTVSGTLAGDKVDGGLDMPHIDPDTLREVFAASPLAEPGSLHFEAHGTLSALAARGHLALGPGTIDVGANARIGTIADVDATVNAKGIDLRAIAPHGESSVLGLHASASAKLSGGLVEGEFRIDSPPGVFGKESVPPIRGSGQFTGTSVEGKVDIAEPGAPARIGFHLHPLAGPDSPEAVDFDVQADAPELARVARLARLAKGSAHLRARGRFFPQTLRVLADAHADVDHLEVSRGAVCLASGRLDASVSGPLSNVAVNADVRGSALALEGHVFEQFDVATRGSMNRGHITGRFASGNTPDVEIDADLRMGQGATLENIDLTMRRANVDAVAHVRRVRVGDGSTSLEGVSIEGLGEAPLLATLRFTPGSLAIAARGEDLDLGRVGRLLDLKDKAPEGHVAFDVNVTTTPFDAKGTVKLDLEGGKYAGVDGATGRLVGSFDGRHLKMDLRGGLGKAGSVTILADDAVLGGGLLQPVSWRSATGHVVVDTNIDLAALMKVAPQGSLPVDQAVGRVSLRGRIGRTVATDLPDVDAEVATQGLVIVTRRAKATDANESLAIPFETHGADAEVALHLKGRTSDASLAARVFDAKGTFVKFTAQTRPPLHRLLQGANVAIGDLEGSPIQMHLLVPHREFADFPEFAKAEVVSMRGAIEAALDVEGTMLAPHVDARARAFDVAPIGAHHPKLVNVDLHATYAGEKAALVLKVARTNAFVVELEAGADVHEADLLRPTAAAAVWNAHGRARFNDFALDTFPGIVPTKVRGTLNGTVTLDGLHQDARLDAKLGLRDLRIGLATFKDAAITAHAEHGTVTAGARLNQADGFAEAHVQGGVAWGNQLVPTLDVHRPIVATLNAKAFRVATAQPFLGDVIQDLDGRMDANTKLTYDFGKKTGTVTGAVDLRDGALDIPNAGGSFHAVRAHVTMDPLGTVHVDDVSADGATGRFTASAIAKLNGLALQSASGKLHVARGQKLPIEIQGIPMGTAWGDVNLKAQVSQDGKTITANVDVPSFHVDLPQSTGHSVQALAPNPDVRVGVEESKSKFALVSLTKPEPLPAPGSSTIHLAIHLGKDVWVKRQTMLNLNLGGGPVVDVAAETRVSGQITSNRGVIEVQSKKFEIDQATVSFVGKDPGDPQIVASAHWDAPDKTRVTVQVTGTPKNINVALHSEPPLPRDAILSLVLFGDAYSSTGASQTGPTGDDEDVNRAAGLAGGVVTDGVNKAISGVTSVDITTRVDTSEAQNPRPELAVQLTNDVSATVIYNLGLPPPGQNPDRTQIVVDYRFYRGWSLLTTFGDAGSSIADLLWQYRY
jgi:translocation and assembly module TamB